ncbi:hypothetical protein BH11MYX1_BH11MYX1_20600 [soil metagenome]
MNFKRAIGFSVAAIFALGACMDSMGAPTETADTTQAVAGAAVTTDQTAYPANSTVTLSYSGLPGNTYDWVAVSAASSADTSYLRYNFTGGATSGTATYAGLPAGSYEARAYVDDSYTVLARSSFTIAGSTAAAVTTDHASYTQGAVVTINYANLPGNQYDWVAISAAGSSASSYVKYVYTNGAVSGSAAFTGIQGGNWEARAYVNDTFTVIASSTFTVQGTPAVTTSQTVYTTGSPVTVNFAGLPGNQLDWVAVSQAGSADTSYVKYVYTGGQTSGSRQFTNLPPGNYEARAYLNDSYTRIATSTFSVTGGVTTPTVTTTQTTYTVGQTVTVNYTNLPGNTYDWVAISVAGSPATSYVKFVYTNGQTSGSQGFTGIPAGNYEARAYSNDSYTVISTSTFTVQ